MALQFRRGSETNRTSITPASGEPIWITDTQRLYVGDGVTAGGVLAGGGGTSTVTNQLLFTTSSVTFAQLTVNTDQIRIGSNAGTVNQGANTVAIGNLAAQNTQTTLAVAIGYRAAYQNQSLSGVAVGSSSAEYNQGSVAVAVGASAGNSNQSTGAVAVGVSAGFNQQSVRATAVGQGAGENYQGYEATALGFNAGRDNQGDHSIAIGCYAGVYQAAANSIILKASGPSSSVLTTVTNSGFYVDPVRSVVTATNRVLCFNTSTREINYSNTAVLNESVNLDSQTGTVTVDSWSTSSYRAAKYQIGVTSGSDMHLVEIMAGHVVGDTYKNEYGLVLSNNEIVTFSTDIDAGNFRLRATSTGTYNVRLIRTLLNI